MKTTGSWNLFGWPPYTTYESTFGDVWFITMTYFEIDFEDMRGAGEIEAEVFEFNPKDQKTDKSPDGLGTIKRVAVLHG